MSLGHREGSLVPRNGHTVVVGIVARISGCTNQKELSLEDQVDHGKETVKELLTGAVEYRVIATKGKGERLDRPELLEIEELLRTRELDLLIVDDLGRLVRGTEAAKLCGIAVDHGVRVIAQNDCIDTDDENWEEDVISACRDHVGHNAHTSKRLKQKLMNRFKKRLGATSREIYGYIKPPGSKTFDDWKKDEAATHYIVEGHRLLRQTLNCTAVADFFNREGVPVGKYCRRRTWDGAMVHRFFKNSMLKGIVGRGFRHTKKHNETGRRISVKNPAGPNYIEVPHLAFLDAAEIDYTLALVEEKNRNFKRHLVNGVDPHLHRARKRTACPGQHARCWYCGSYMVWGGNGVPTNLMCSGARQWMCWNSIGINGELTASRLVEAISNELDQLGGLLEAQFAELVRTAQQEQSGRSTDLWKQLEQDERALSSEKDNLMNTILQYGPRPMLQEKLTELEGRERRLVGQRHRLTKAQAEELQVPLSVAELRHLFKTQFQELAINSSECGDLLRQLIPEFHVHLVRRCDGGRLQPRARIKLALDGIIPDAAGVPGLHELLSRELTIDLFEPCQRERIREDAVRLTAAGLTQREISAAIPEHPTQPAIQNALALHKRMLELHLTSPYVLLEEPPADYTKLRRHLNPKFRFESVPGYERKPL